ncbi:ribosome-binding factor A [Thiohalospira halophila DSM 15071]|uniref:Ribosome-binding factor A n=1 Tax=Thiohalospira halophila DSM 15071 TaxID=1123397 RepID=A0A1I1VQ48_9GAMM|nr:30S ribosome-binding factor RbfA [Thiohalospira halophila]SFD84975.1 ribosome-binding factor A [Thiohalospira halophila DSM 15071]
MAREYGRNRRMGDQLQRELADLVRTQVKDPRAEGVTISEVDVSPDMRNARVYIARLGGEAEAIEEAVEALSGAAGFLRRELGRRLHARRIPELRFRADTSFDRAAHLSRVIDDAVSRDRGDDDEPDEQS